MSIRISWSQIQKFMSCQRKWSLEYQQGLQRKKTDSTALRRGFMFHAAMEAYLLNGYSMSAAMDALADTMLDYQNQGYEITADYDNVKTSFQYYVPRMGWGVHKHVVSQMPDGGLIKGYAPDSVPLVEYEFMYELTPDISISGFVDAVVYDDSHDMYIVCDWKYRSRMQSELSAGIDGQLHLYAAILNDLLPDAPIEAVEMWQFRNNPPSPPRLKADGTPSIAAQTATWNSWWNGLPYGHKYNADVWAKKMNPKLKEESYFVQVTQSAVTTFSNSDALNNATSAGTAMLLAQQFALYPATLSAYTCSLCSHKDLCETARYGDDLTTLIADRYELPLDTVDPIV